MSEIIKHNFRDWDNDGGSGGKQAKSMSSLIYNMLRGAVEYYAELKPGLLDKEKAMIISNLSSSFFEWEKYESEKQPESANDEKGISESFERAIQKSLKG